MISEQEQLPVTTEEEAASRVIAIVGAAPKLIKSESEYTNGMNWLGAVVKRRKMIEAFFESIKAPIRKSLKTVAEKETNILQPLVAEESKLKQLTGTFFLEQKRKAEEKQAEINRKHEEKVQAGIAAGKDVSTMPAARVVQTLQTTVKQDGRPSIAMRLIKNWRVTKIPTFNQQTEGKIYRSDDTRLAEIPDRCWVLDTKRAMEVAKSGLSPAMETFDVPSQAVSG